VSDRGDVERGKRSEKQQVGVVEYVLPYEDVEGLSLSPVSLLNTVLRHRRRLIISSLLFGVGVALLTVALRKYEAEASFAPQSNQANPSSLAGLASQFGFNLATLNGGPPLDFYAAIANSRATLTSVASTQFRVASDAESRDTIQGNLVELLHVRGSSSLDRLQRAVKKLDHMVTVTKDEDAGIVTVTVKAKTPSLAEQIARRLLSIVNDVNLTQHQNQAAAEREFVVGRLSEIRGELDSAEDNLLDFSLQNRTVENSPRLSVEQGRLQRRVDFLQQVYLTLAQSYERARVEEARNTPVITVIDAPEGSGKKTASVLLAAIIGLVLGVVLGLVQGIARDYMASQRAAASPEYREFADLRTRAIEELTALPRAIAATARARRRSSEPT
jgi:uncharacterized protein involved in exopolysaccharide biosynthesis